MSKMVRQGDVLFVPVKALPVPKEGTEVKGGDRDAAGRLIVQHGEVTGHAHAILEKSADVKEIILADGIARYLDAPEGATLVHEDHGTINIEPGQYNIVIQREYTPEAPRYVLD